MSDFGSVLIASKNDEGSFSNSEIKDIAQKLETIIKEDEHLNALGDSFMHEFQEEEGSKSILALLSEHYYGEDDEDSFEFVEETELDEVKEIADKLVAEFPDVKFEAKVIEW